MTSEPDPAPTDEPAGGPSSALSGPSPHEPSRSSAPSAPSFVTPGGKAVPDRAPSIPPAAVGDPSTERRLHPAATAIDAIRHARSAGAAMLVVIVSQGLLVGLGIIGALLLLGALAAFLQWRTTRYAVVDGALRLRTGIFSRNERNIPASRISALDTSRGVLQRIFGVVAVQVQTAGGGKEAEISLRAVSFEEAERLRRALGHRAGATAGPAPAAASDATATAATGAGPSAPAFTDPLATPDDPAPVVYAMAPRELMVAALTSPSIAVVGAGVAAAFSLGNDALPSSVQRQIENSVSDLTLTAALVVIVAGLLVAAVVSVAGTILVYGGFRVTRDDKRLRVRRGLLTERVGTIPIDRIHGVRVIESPLRQLLGYAAIEVEVAGYASQDEVTRTVVPLVRREAIPALLHEIVPAISWPQAPLEAVPDRARRRYLTAPLWVAAPFTVATLAAPIGAFRLLAIVFPVIAIWQGRREARDAGWLLSDGTLTLRSRTIGRVTVLAESRRLQRVEGRTSVFQRRANLGTFSVRLSNARGARVRHLDEDVVHALLSRSGR